MVTIANLAETAALIGDPARASMLVTMMDGRAFAAGELSRVAGISAPTASGHLARLVGAGILAVERQGRHRYFRLASPEIGAILEGLLVVTAHRRSDRPSPLRVGPRDIALRRARICYDHIAGEIGVALFAALVERDQLRIGHDGAELTEAGRSLFAAMDVPVEQSRAGVPMCRPCLDWSERRHHLAGAAGAALCRAALDRGWLRRREGTRALSLTPTGAAAFHAHFGLSR